MPGHDAKHDPFSLVLGGPLFQLFRRAHLSGDANELLQRRLLALTAIAWLPLLLLSAVAGDAWGDGVALPFVADVQLQVRLLFALPLLVIAELVVHRRMQPMVDQFEERGLIADAEQPRYDAALDAALRLRNSTLAELLLLAFVYGVGVLVIWRSHLALDVSSWYGGTVDGMPRTTLAGLWLGWVSLPLFQFLLLRWYFRMFIWARFLWQVSRLRLRILPTHPDGCGGLGFLGLVSQAFAPLLLAQGALLAGLIADHILYGGAKLLDFKLELVGTVAVFLFAILGPMLVFIPQLIEAKFAALRDYGALAERYAREFDAKWSGGGAPAGQALLGNADAMSLAALADSYRTIERMRLVPFTLATVIQLTVFTLAPLLPLALTMFSFEQLVERLLKIVV